MRDYNKPYRSDRAKFKTTCANCGKDCEVPFRPTGSKPVYCDDCFSEQKGSGSYRNGGQSYGGSRSFRGNGDRGFRSERSGQSNKRELDLINQKLDVLLEAVAKLTGENQVADITNSEDDFVESSEGVAEDKPRDPDELEI